MEKQKVLRCIVLKSCKVWQSLEISLPKRNRPGHCPVDSFRAQRLVFSLTTAVTLVLNHVFADCAFAVKKVFGFEQTSMLVCLILTNKEVNTGHTHLDHDLKERSPIYNFTHFKQNNSSSIFLKAQSHILRRVQRWREGRVVGGRGRVAPIQREEERGDRRRGEVRRGENEVQFIASNEEVVVEEQRSSLGEERSNRVWQVSSGGRVEGEGQEEEAKKRDRGEEGDVEGVDKDEAKHRREGKAEGWEGSKIVFVMESKDLLLEVLEDREEDRM